MLCRKCGVDVPHVCAPEQLLVRAVVDCPIKKGAIWVQVTGQGGAGLEGVSVRVARVDPIGTKPTDPTGFIGFDPLDEHDDYVVEITAVPGLLEPSYGLPLLARSPAPVQPGEITFLSFALAPRIKPVLTLSKAVVGVGGARITAKLEAAAVAGGACPFAGKGTGTLTVAKGAASLKLYRENVEVALVANKVTFAAVPAEGITLELEAVDASAYQGIELEWALASDTLPVVAEPDKKVATAAKAELVAETKLAKTLSSQQQRVDGGVVHLQNVGGTRVRLKVTPRCSPPELVGKLELTAIKDNIEVYDADTAGNLVDLGTAIDVGPGQVAPPVYVQGKTVSTGLADTGLTLALVDVIDRADLVKLTVVEIKLEVYGGTPGPSDPAVKLTADKKLDPGRRLYVQETTNWWWGRAKVQVTKNPPLAPCKLSLRQAGGAGSIRLFPETGGDPVGSLEAHREGEAAEVLPLELAVDALPDAVAGRVYWAEGATATGADKRNLFVDIVDVEQGCDQVAFRVLQPLDEFDRINVVDPGGPGTGHQSAVLKLLASLAAIGFGGEVVLTYNTLKTRIYASNFGKRADLDHPTRSYALYHAPWDGEYPTAGAGRHKLAIRCRPLGALAVALTPAQRALPAADLQAFWTGFAWPGATPGPCNDLAPPQPFGPVRSAYNEKKKWAENNPRLANDQTAWRQTFVYKTEINDAKIDTRNLLALAPVRARTLNAFGAMDFHVDDPLALDRAAYFDDHWRPVLRTMTGEEHPVAMIFQPFLWTGGHPMQVRQHTIMAPVDVTAKVRASGGKAVYRFVPPDAAGDDGVIGGMAGVPQFVLQKAKAREAYLVSAYYGRSVSSIEHVHLLMVLARVIKQAELDKAVIVAILGDESTDAPEAIARDFADPTVVYRTNTDPIDPDTYVELVHVGRTKTPLEMVQFQRYSTVFVTEGANTWQEMLAMGTPTLSAKPDGNTTPWTEDEPAGIGTVRTTVREASEAMIEAGRSAKAAKDSASHDRLVAYLNNAAPDAVHARLVAYLNAALDANSDVSNYFKDWKRLLADPHSDQVVTAVNYLPDPADNA